MCDSVSLVSSSFLLSGRAFPKPISGRNFTQATVRISGARSAITGMYFKPQERSEPFGPMTTLADGRRSAILSDFQSHIELLAHLADRAANPVLRARLSDICWFLERKRGRLAPAAISAYAEIVERTDRDGLKHRLRRRVVPFNTMRVISGCAQCVRQHSAFAGSIQNDCASGPGNLRRSLARGSTPQYYHISKFTEGIQ